MITLTINDNVLRYLKEYLLEAEIDRADHEPNYDRQDRKALNELCDAVDNALPEGPR